MSSWTHITACLSIETNIIAPKSELRKQIKTILKTAPKITGSEQNADIFINIQSGYTWFISHDCEHCKYKETLRKVIIDGEEGQECDAPDNYDCSGKYQTAIVISIQGDLRDREFSQTKEEFEDFLNFINTRFHVCNYTYKIEGE